MLDSTFHVFNERPNNMAKKGSVNRTEKVQQYVREHPDESITEVLDAMKRRGYPVSRSLVSQVRKKLGLSQSGGPTKKKATRKTAQKKVASPTTATAKPKVITADDLYEAKTLADELGGIERVREALDALERLK